ncbi:MAG: hypothetical protein ACE5E0_05650 [Terriglobia bacterium]
MPRKTVDDLALDCLLGGDGSQNCPDEKWLVLLFDEPRSRFNGYAVAVSMDEFKSPTNFSVLPIKQAGYSSRRASPPTFVQRTNLQKRAA